MHPSRPIPDIEYRLAVLQYVRSKADIRPLLKATGENHVKLHAIIDSLVAEGFIDRLENGLGLTDKGKIYLRRLNMKLGRRGLYAYLLPDYTAKRVQMKKTEIYIPQYMYGGGEGHFSGSYIYFQ